MLLEQWILMASGGAPAVANGTPLFTLGTNDKGQLGIDSTTTTSSPVQVGTSEFLKIATGSKHTLAIKDDFTLWAWGDNSYGQLGDGTFISRSSPVQIGSGTYKDISACENSSFAISQQNKLYAWGDNEAGQLGNNDLSSGEDFSWILVSAGGDGNTTFLNQSAGIKADGSLWVWGQSGPSSGIKSIITSPERVLLGDDTSFPGVTIKNKSSPVQIGIGYSWELVNMKQKLALTTDGKLFSWGINTNGEVGDNTRNLIGSPLQIASGTSFIQIASGDSGHRMRAAIDSSWRLYTWGVNTAAGNLGQSTSTSKSAPTQVLGTVSFAQVAITSNPYNANEIAVAAIRFNPPTLYTWGAQALCGRDISANTTSPTQLGTKSWSFITAGHGTFYGIDSSYRLYYWGLNPLSESAVYVSSPVQIGVGSSFRAVYSGGGFAVGLLSTVSGALRGWGRNTHGQFGISTVNNFASSVTSLGVWDFAVAGSISASSSRFSCGTNHILYVNNGKLYAAGSNKFGQLGNNKQTEFTSSPIQIGSKFNSPVQIGNSSWSLVSSGGNFTHAIRADGTLWGWGRNQQTDVDAFSNEKDNLFNSTVEYCQLGDGTTIDRSSPVQIGTSSWSFIKSAPKGMTFGISNSQLYAIGKFANFGQLNGAPLVTRISNTAIFDRGTIIKDDGSLWFTYSRANRPSNLFETTNGPYTWVYDSSTGLINRRAGFDWGSTLGWTTGNEKGPYLSTRFGNNTFNQVSIHRSAGAAIDSTGRLFMWGKNINGQCGQNFVGPNDQYYSSPVQIGTSSWNMVAVGNNNVVAIRADGTLWGWGLNENGELGNTDRVPRSSPVQIGTSSWSFVSMGEDAVFGISDGRLFSWGYGLSGNLGHIGSASRSAPVQITFSFNANTWVKAGGDNYRTFGLLANGEIWAWGQGNNGVFGKNSNTNISYPDRASQGGPYGDFTYYTHTGTCHALSTDGKLWVLGGDVTIGSAGSQLNHVAPITFGQTLRSTPVQIGLTSQGLSYVGFTSAVEGHLKVSNSSSNTFLTVYENYAKPGTDTNFYAGPKGIVPHGGYSIHDVVAELSPVLVSASNNWTTVTSGKSNVIALNSSNNLFQIASTNTLVRYSNVYVDCSANNLTENYLVADTFGFAARTEDNKIFTWGNVNDPSVNTGINSTYLSQPDGAGEILGGSWSQLSLGDRIAFGIRADGTLWGWGRNAHGALGINLTGSLTTYYSSPVQIGTSSWSFVTVGGGTSDNHVHAIRADGTLWAWGVNDFSQLGDNSLFNRSQPVQIASGSWTFVTNCRVGGHAIRSDGTLWGWGDTVFGARNGDGTSTDRSAPVQIGSSTWVGVATGAHASFAIRSDGTLWGWGRNDSSLYGARFNNASTNILSPIQIGSANNWTKVVASKQTNVRSDNGFYVINNKNELYCNLGSNYTGTVGNGDHTYTTGRRSTLEIYGQELVQIPGRWKDVASHGRFVIAIDMDGLLYFWGQNIYSAVGSSRGSLHTDIIYTPTQIGIKFSGTSFTQIGSANGDTWKAISSGDGIELAVSNSAKLHAWGRNKTTLLPSSNNINVPITTSDNTVIATNTVNVSIGSSHIAILKEL